MDIKICGIRRKEDIDIVNKYKPEYIGFIFAPTRRYVSPEFAADLKSHLADGIKAVGVFVNESAEKVLQIAKTVPLDVIQLHGDEDEEYIKSLGHDFEIWKAVRISGGEKIPETAGADRVLLDKYDTSEYGGIGKTFDWSAGVNFESKTPVMLAGGLNKENVLQGIEIFNPVGVDVSSGVETDGVKDGDKIREFIKTVRGQI